MAQAVTPANPLRLRELDHVALRVRDLARSEAFYCDVLGCQVAARNPDIGLVHLQAGSRWIDLVLLDGRMGAVGGTDMRVESRNMHHLCLSYHVHDSAALFAYLDSLQIAHSAQAQTNLGAEGDGTSVYLQDPDGHLIEIKCYPAAASDPA